MAASVWGTSLRDAFEHISRMPDRGEDSPAALNMSRVWISVIPLENSEIVFKQSGRAQRETSYYTEQASRALRHGAGELILMRWAPRNHVEVFANSIAEDKYEVLIRLDMTSHETSVAIYGHTDSHTIELLKHGEITFPSDGSVGLYIPIIESLEYSESAEADNQ